MDNPYRHDQFKPHLIDRGEIRLLCFEIYSIVNASMSRQGSGLVDEDEPRELFLLDQLFFSQAESELSKRLLRLALLVRTFDDTMTRTGGNRYVNHRDRVESDFVDFGTVYKGDAEITKTIRECCNKIIHAEDVRPVYDTGDDRDDPNAMWGMDGTIELEGEKGRESWNIAIYLYDYLEGVLELIKFDE
jgi:hypothetical protein